MPSIYVENWLDTMLFKLVKSGYGDAMKILATPTDVVVGALHYEDFVAEFENQLIRLNKK